MLNFTHPHTHMHTHRYGTHTLVAPSLAALALNAVDYYNTYDLIKKREVKAAAQTKQSKSGGSSGARSSSEK